MVVMLALVVWVVELVSAITPIKVVWWMWGDNALTPLVENAESSNIEVVGRVESMVTTTLPQDKIANW